MEWFSRLQDHDIAFLDGFAITEPIKSYCGNHTIQLNFRPIAPGRVATSELVIGGPSSGSSIAAATQSVLAAVYGSMVSQLAGRGVGALGWWQRADEFTSSETPFRFGPDNHACQEILQLDKQHADHCYGDYPPSRWRSWDAQDRTGIEFGTPDEMARCVADRQIVVFGDSLAAQLRNGMSCAVEAAPVAPSNIVECIAQVSGLAMFPPVRHRPSEPELTPCSSTWACSSSTTTSSTSSRPATARRGQRRT